MLFLKSYTTKNTFSYFSSNSNLNLYLSLTKTEVTKDSFVNRTFLSGKSTSGLPYLFAIIFISLKLGPSNAINKNSILLSKHT